MRKVNQEQIGLVLLGMGLGMAVQKGISITRKLLEKDKIEELEDVEMPNDIIGDIDKRKDSNIKIVE